MNPLDILNRKHKEIETGLGLNSPMPFGKHKGTIIYNVIQEDVSYIAWCIENVESFKLDNEAYVVYDRALTVYNLDKAERNKQYDDDFMYGGSVTHLDDLPF